jgi:hypothetical protein
MLITLNIIVDPIMLCYKQLTDVILMWFPYYTVDKHI